MMLRLRLSHRLAIAGLTCLLLQGIAAVAGAETDPWTDRLRQAVEIAACARNGFAPDRVEVELHRVVVPDEYHTASGITIEIPEYDDAIGPVTARACFTLNGKTLGNIPVPARITVFADALVTKRRIARHEVIGDADVEPKTLEITSLVKWAMTDRDSVVGHWAGRTINPGQIVDRRWLEDIPLIQRGDRVTLAYASGSVRVTTNVIAMEDGYQDQQIMVKSAQAKRLLPAIVVDGNTVTPAR
jgi:flagella basal body P-ring formation protein FlgA